MKIHRFYVPDVNLTHEFWFSRPEQLNQWIRVLRFKPGQEVVLFDGQNVDRLYKITELTANEAHLELITDFQRQVPKTQVYLFWALLTKDKNDWVLQKATELGVSHLIPLVTERTTKTGFNLERAKKIVVEAAEQCGRSDIPSVREPLHIDTALNEFKDKVALFVCEQGGEQATALPATAGVLIGPEGGWSARELELFTKHHLKQIHLHDFTLRAETAALAAATKLLQ